jgi:VWFA-related protein
MCRAFAWVLVATAGAAAGVGLRAQQAPGAGFATSTTAVVVDVVVRDGKGNPVLDLKPSDFELLEDDVRQRITSVQLIAPGRPAAAAGRAAGTGPGDPAPPATRPEADASAPGDAGDAGPTIIALAFHRLSPDARVLAHRAARSYVEGAIAPNDFAGVFLVDTGLETLQTFTTDRQKLAAAVEKVARTQTTTVTRNQPMAAVFGDASPDVSPTAGAESGGRPLNESGFQPRKPLSQLSEAERAARSLQDMAERLENTFEEMMRDRNGHAETAALTALASSLGSLPGRKTVVFFSEGLSVPAAVEAKFRAVIETANRSNVSFYTVDAKGLKVHSEQAATARGIAAIRGVGDDDPLQVAENEKRRARTTDLERNEFLLRKDPAAALTMLANETGGFLIDNTNDLASAFARIDADRRFHYLLTYAPKNTAQDGTFRRISVKVKRRGADVRARSGYVAVPALGAIPVLRFETNALAALAASPRPTQIRMQAAAFEFPEADGRARVALFVTLPASGVAYFVDDRQTAYQTHFTILARVLDDAGNTLRKGSQPYRTTGPAKDVHVARQGAILFYRQPTLDPGRYTVEYALYDELSGQAGTGALPVEVARREPGGLAMSSLVLVERAEAVPEDQRDPLNPLYFGSTLIYPNLGAPVARSKRGSLVFYYTARGTGRPLAGRIELLQDGRAVASRDMAVPAADASGRVQHANELPLDGVGPGPSELRVTLSDGRSSVVRSTAFVLQP